jgi:hypothetical protein
LEFRNERGCCDETRIDEGICCQFLLPNDHPVLPRPCGWQFDEPRAECRQQEHLLNMALACPILLLLSRVALLVSGLARWRNLKKGGVAYERLQMFDDDVVVGDDSDGKQTIDDDGIEMDDAASE